jgi:hypothetical protein
LRFVYDKIFHDPHKTPTLGLYTMFGVYKDCGVESSEVAVVE